MSRLMEITEGGAVLTNPDLATTPVPKARTEIEKARRVYLENYLKQLP
jgi:hypothetical protein